MFLTMDRQPYAMGKEVVNYSGTASCTEVAALKNDIYLSELFGSYVKCSRIRSSDVIGKH